MFIELRNDYETRGYLVDSNEINKDSEQRGAWCWLDLSAIDSMHFVESIGNGSKMFLFEGAGIYAPAVTAIIHADTKLDAERRVEEKYGDRIKRKNLIRKQGLIEIIDERIKAI